MRLSRCYPCDRWNSQRRYPYLSGIGRATSTTCQFNVTSTAIALSIQRVDLLKKRWKDSLVMIFSRCSSVKSGGLVGWTVTFSSSECWG